MLFQQEAGISSSSSWEYIIYSVRSREIFIATRGIWNVVYRVTSSDGADSSTCAHPFCLSGKLLCVWMMMMIGAHTRSKTRTKYEKKKKKKSLWGSLLVMMMDLYLYVESRKRQGLHSIAPVYCWWHVSSSLVFLEEEEKEKKPQSWKKKTLCSNGIIISMIGFN